MIDAALEAGSHQAELTPCKFILTPRFVVSRGHRDIRHPEQHQQTEIETLDCGAFKNTAGKTCKRIKLCKTDPKFEMEHMCGCNLLLLSEIIRLFVVS